MTVSTSSPSRKILTLCMPVITAFHLCPRHSFLWLLDFIFNSIKIHAVMAVNQTFCEMIQKMRQINHKYLLKHEKA